jgi:hypothetical protein
VCTLPSQHAFQADWTNRINNASWVKSDFPRHLLKHEVQFVATTIPFTDLFIEGIIEAILLPENSPVELGCPCSQLHLAKSLANGIARHPRIYYIASSIQSGDERLKDSKTNS